MNRHLFWFAPVMSFYFALAAHAQFQFIDTGITYETLARAGINASGEIFAVADNVTRLRSAAGVVSLVSPPPGYVAVHAGSINASGALGGRVFDAAQNARAMIRRADGTYIFPNVSGQSNIGGLNDAGDAAGWTFTGSPERPFRYTAVTGVVTFLNPPPGAQSAQANMINNSGVIGGLGIYLTSPGIGTSRIIRYAPDGTVSVMPGPLDEGSDALYMNNFGDIAGSEALTPVVWKVDGSEITLGGTGIAMGINDVGDVVGTTVSSAVTWNGVGTPINLNNFLTPAQRVNYRLFAAWDVNDSHTIVGEAKFDPDGAAGPLEAVNRVYLLTIPEPSLAAPLALAMFAFAGFRRRQLVS